MVVVGGALRGPVKKGRFSFSDPPPNVVPSQQCKHVGQMVSAPPALIPLQQCKHVSQVVSAPATVVPSQQNSDSPAAVQTC